MTNLKKRFLIPAMLSLAAGIFAENPFSKTFTIIESSQPHDLNPTTSNYSSDTQVLVNIYEGLFAYDPETLDSIPALCVDYRISRDKKRWTFHLRENARFSDGSKITAEDVRRSWIDLLSTPDAPYASLLYIIENAENFRMGKISESEVGISVLSPTSFSIRLTNPCPYLPKLLCLTSFSVTAPNPTVYSGAFYIEDMNDKEILLAKNPYYWDAENVFLETAVFTKSFGSDDNAYYFNTGAADWIAAYDVDSTKLIEKQAVQINAQFGTEYLFFKQGNFNDYSLGIIWEVPDARRAILEAMPWEILRESNVIPATTFVYPLSGYPRVEGYSYTDEKEAAILFKEVRKKCGISEEQKIPLKLCISENGISKKAVEAVKKAMEPLGVDFQVQYVPSYQYLDIIKVSDAHLFAYNWIGDFADPMAFLELFRGDSTMNESGWKNTRYDQLLDKSADPGLNESERYNVLAQAETILLDDGMILPIAHPITISIIDSREISGWYQNAFNIHPLKYIKKRSLENNIANVVKR